MPKIRIGALHAAVGSVRLKTGELVRFHLALKAGDADTVPLPHREVAPILMLRAFSG